MLGTPDAVAVAADPADDPVDEVALEGVRFAGPPGAVGPPTRIPEPQRVHDGDRPRTHREDVAQDPADPGGRALVRLDVARVVVGFDLERDGSPSPTSTTPAFSPGPASTHEASAARPRRWIFDDLYEPVLGPHHRVHPSSDTVGVPTERVHDPVVLVAAQAQLVPELAARSGVRVSSGKLRSVTGAGLRGSGSGGAPTLLQHRPAAGGRAGPRYPRRGPVRRPSRIPARPPPCPGRLVRGRSQHPPRHPRRHRVHRRPAARLRRPGGTRGPCSGSASWLTSPCGATCGRRSVAPVRPTRSPTSPADGGRAVTGPATPAPASARTR
jgi:hypothetical protein